MGRRGQSHNTTEPVAMTTESASARMRYVGLDVHAETITAAVAEMDGAVHDLGTIANAPAALRKLMRKLGPIGALRVCYEAGRRGTWCTGNWSRSAWRARSSRRV